MTTLFVVCFLVGLGLSVVSFVSGLDRISVFDQIFGHGHHIGSHHHGRIAVKHGSHAVARVSPFNMAALTAFLAWFGGTGTVLLQVAHFSTLVVVGTASAAGLVGGSVVNRFLRVLMRAEKPLAATSIVGLIAKVTSPIRVDGTGEVVFTMNGTRHVTAARAENGIAIERGEEVVVVRHEKGIAYVATWGELGA